MNMKALAPLGFTLNNQCATLFFMFQSAKQTASL